MEYRLWSECEHIFLFLCRDMFCGKLFCHNGKDNPNYGRMVRVGDCKAAFFEDYTKDYGQVDAGTKCEDGKVICCGSLCKTFFCLFFLSVNHSVNVFTIASRSTKKPHPPVGTLQH